MTGVTLVTGANGLLGSRCVAALARDPDRRVLATWNRGVNRLIATPPLNLSYLKCDLTDPAAVVKIFDREMVDAVLHTAVLLPDALPHYEERAVAANVLATVNLAAAALAAGCPRFVFCSSVSVYGTTAINRRFAEEDSPAPEDAYGWSKVAAEQYLQLCCARGGISGVSLRLAGLHGPGRQGGIFYRAAQAAIQRQPIQLPHTRVPFQFLYLDDAVESTLRALDTNVNETLGYTVINVASAVAPSLCNIVTAAARRAGIDSMINVNPSAPVRYQIMATDRLAHWPSWRAHGIEETLASLFGWIEAKEQPGGFRL